MRADQKEQEELIKTLKEIFKNSSTVAYTAKELTAECLGTISQSACTKVGHVLKKLREEGFLTYTPNPGGKKFPGEWTKAGAKKKTVSEREEKLAAFTLKVVETLENLAHEGREILEGTKL